MLMGYPEITWIKMLFTTTVVFGMYTMVTYFLAWDVIKVWIWAWCKRSPISLEWTKSKQWMFQVPTIQKGVPEMWELDGCKRVIQVRREAVGIAPHKITMMLSTSEFPAAISPTEIHGDRFYSPDEMLYGMMYNNKVISVEPPTEDELKRFDKLDENFKNIKHMEENPEYKIQNQDEYNILFGKITSWGQRKLWVKYPEHGLDASEFVKYQKVSTDPKIFSAYARNKELQAKEDLRDNWTQFLGSLPYVAPVILIIGIVYIIVQNNQVGLGGVAQALACEAKYSELALRCGEAAGSIKDAVVQGAGGGVK